MLRFTIEIVVSHRTRMLLKVSVYFTRKFILNVSAVVQPKKAQKKAPKKVKKLNPLAKNKFLQFFFKEDDKRIIN